MKSVKAKLFTLYAITISVILAFLTFISLYFLEIHKENQMIELIDITSNEIYTAAFEDEVAIKDIDKYVDLKNQFLIIFTNKKLAFTNQSSYKTQNILDEIKEEQEEYSIEEMEELYLKIEQEGFIQIEGFLFIFDYFEEKGILYEVYLGVNKKLLDESIDSIYETIIIFNIVILIILLLLGYFLIARTISPLKEILNEVKQLRSDKELDKRLKVLATGDEFEELSKSFNGMLENIENSVNNIKQFSSDASHELKTPLTVIQGVIDLCKDKQMDKDEFDLVIKKIDKEQIKLQNIINSFLLLSRLDKEQIGHKKASLDKVVFESIESNLEAIEQKNLELKIDIQEDIQISFDENYLSIVVNNLISNAIKYTKKGYISIQTQKQNDKTVLNITDTGIGIKTADLKNIFERFYRVDKVRTSSKEGIGLGLSIVKKICDKYDTSIKVQSKEDKGTSFILLFK